MKRFHTARLLSAFIILCSVSLLKSEDGILHYDLLPMFAPDDAEFFNGLSKRLHDIKAGSELEDRHVTQELAVYIFFEDVTLAVRVITERDNTKYSRPVASSIEFRKCRVKGDLEPVTSIFPISKSFEREFSNAWRSLLFRTNAKNYHDRINHSSPWMMVTGWGLQGMAYSPYSESPLGLLLSQMKSMMEAGAGGKIDSETILAIEKNVVKISQMVKPKNGVWSLEVADPYTKTNDDSNIHRFSYEEFLVP